MKTLHVLIALVIALSFSIGCGKGKEKDAAKKHAELLKMFSAKNKQFMNGDKMLKKIKSVDQKISGISAPKGKKIFRGGKK